MCVYKKYRSKIIFLTQLFWQKSAPSRRKLLYKIMGAIFFKFLKRGRFRKWVWEILFYTISLIWINISNTFEKLYFFDIKFKNKLCFLKTVIKRHKQQILVAISCKKNNLKKYSTKKLILFVKKFDKILDYWLQIFIHNIQGFIKKSIF